MMRSIFVLPAIIASVTLFGLVVALTGQGWPDFVACLALMLPPAAVGAAFLRALRIRARRR
ncbi:hypothetical protein [Stakelama tenebrarum]|uniref:Uncharacterized protein n=1 Tax=Stakelama tenebrarum TaxID=2711215 RepID=A0A6G6Y396_9SPHN|nr:hypothetical protein [Sphingosinithalassobacter tenebrarum]QIG79395.1 hypothetical protein G5C33_06050 [Sphingosinithalassobacter tenebrarum]